MGIFSYLRGYFPGKVLGGWCVWLWMRRGILRSLQIGEYSSALDNDGGTPELEESVAFLWRFHLWCLCLCLCVLSV